MASVLVAGHICLDLTPALGALPTLAPGELAAVGGLELRAGGSVANTGGALAALGVAVRAQADVGDDPLADVLHDRVRARGIDATGLRRTAGSTSYSLVIQPPGHDRTFWHHVGANSSFDGRGVVLGDERLLHVGYPSLLPALAVDAGAPLVELFARANAAGVATSLDLAVVSDPDASTRAAWTAFLDAVLPRTDVVSPSHDDLESALGLAAPRNESDVVAAARGLVGRGAAIAVVSAGSRGLALATGDAARFARAGAAVAGLAPAWHERATFLAAPRVAAPATTNGAGDAATAGLLAEIVGGTDPDPALAVALDAATRVVSGLPLASS